MHRMVLSMAKVKQTTFTDQIRNALTAGEKSRYAISRETGLSEPQLCRFVNGEGLSMKSLDTLAEYLGLVVVIRKPQKRKGK